MKSILDVYEEVKDGMSQTIKISHDQVIEVVVADLTSKYLSNVKRGDKEWSDAFEKVLSFYLTQEELDHLTSRSSGTPNGVR